MSDDKRTKPINLKDALASNAAQRAQATVQVSGRVADGRERPELTLVETQSERPQMPQQSAPPVASQAFGVDGRPSTDIVRILCLDLTRQAQATINKYRRYQEARAALDRLYQQARSAGVPEPVLDGVLAQHGLLDLSYDPPQ